jgi:arsenate reductase (thioredoxin)
MKKRKILYFCKHNSCRSQMAEGILRHLAGDQFEVYSAGLYPAPIHPLVYTVMAEIGIDISRQTSKSIDLYLGRELMDTVFIVCQEGEAECPKLYPMALKVERWPLPDPASVIGQKEAVLSAFRNTRDMLETKIRAWLDKMEIENQPDQEKQ